MEIPEIEVQTVGIPRIPAPGVVAEHNHKITANGNASDLKEISIGNNSKL